MCIKTFLSGSNKDKEKSAKIEEKTRMTTFIKAKLKKLDRQANIQKYRVAAQKICFEYNFHSISFN